MSNVTPGPNANVPSVPSPIATLGGLQVAVAYLKQGMDSLAGVRGPAVNRAVTFNDLINLGVVKGTGTVNSTTTSVVGVITTTAATLPVVGPDTLLGNPSSISAIAIAFAVGSGLSFTGGSLVATAVSSLWNAGTVNAIGTGLSINSGGTLIATGGGGGSVIAGAFISVTSGSTVAFIGTAPNGMLPLVNGDLPGPVPISDVFGQFIGVAL